MRRYRRLPLGSLRFFDAVATTQSFTKAAGHLHVSQAAVSQAIRSLENYCGVRLFVRHGGRASLTEEGHRFYERVRSALIDIAAAFDDVRTSEDRRVIVLTVLPSFMLKWLVPRIGDFYSRHPAIELRIITDRRPLDFDMHRIDAGVRFGVGAWPRLRASRLLGEWWLPVCAPTYAERLSRPFEVKALLGLPLLQSNTELWSAWFEQAGVQEKPSTTRCTFDDSAHVVEAAAAGLGVGLVRWTLAKDDLAAGRLVRAHPLALPDPFSYFFVSAAPAPSDQRIGALRDWFQEQCQDFASPV